jgi:hypothetical protein
VREFVTRNYFHGIPYEEARSLGPQALAELEQMLSDPSMKAHWARIVTMIAYIGAPRSFRILKSFTWERFSGTVDDETWRALLLVPNVMGAIPDAPGAPVSEYLERGTNPAFWDSLPWTERLHARYGDLSLVLSKVSINGLAATGTRRAALALAKLRDKPYSKRQVPTIMEGIKVNEEISRIGIAEYQKRTKERLGHPRKPGGRPK